VIVFVLYFVSLLFKYCGISFRGSCLYAAS